MIDGLEDIKDLAGVAKGLLRVSKGLLKLEDMFTQSLTLPYCIVSADVNRNRDGLATLCV